MQDRKKPPESFKCKHKQSSSIYALCSNMGNEVCCLLTYHLCVTCSVIDCDAFLTPSAAEKTHGVVCFAIAVLPCAVSSALLPFLSSTALEGLLEGIVQVGSSSSEPAGPYRAVTTINSLASRC